MKSITLSIGALIVFGIVAILMTLQSQQAMGSAFTGSVATLSSATTTTVGPDTNVTIFNSTKSCTSRIVTTNYAAIRFTTGDVAGFGSTTLANGNGLTQAASTTVAYDGGIYGCGRWTAEAIASTSITVVENQ